MGACFVYTGTRTAPSLKTGVAYALACLLIAASLALFVLFRETLSSDAGMIVGAVAIAGVVASKKLDLAAHRLF